MKVYESATELIGGTPLLNVKNYCRERCVEDATILAKLEYLNPAGSVKDRVALGMLEEAEKRGRLRAGATVIEPTSGNTGIGLASVAAAKGYQVILTIPDTMSKERIDLLKAYGARVVLTEGAKGMAGSVEKAKELELQIEGAMLLGQFENPANPDSHRQSTAPEIWEDTDGRVDIFVAGVGTGGTITGIGRYLKEKNPSIKIVAFEPADSPLLSEGRAGAHDLQGIGANFIPSILDKEVYDEVLTISTQEAYIGARTLAHKEGILVGITSGAAIYAAELLARREENKGKIIVALLPDSGDRYMSTPLFKEDV